MRSSSGEGACGLGACERKVEASRKGKPIKAPAEEPRDEEQVNLTDADSSLMRKSRRHEYRQAAQARGRQLVLGSG